MPTEVAGDGRPKRVALVVDDVADLRDLYATELEWAGFLVVTATNGHEGVQKAFAFRPDAIVMDFSMPAMSGAQAIRQLARDPRTRSIPIVMLTAFADDIPDDVRWECRGFLEKPCAPDRLVALLRSLLGGARSE